jgi:hypothetical protein
MLNRTVLTSSSSFSPGIETLTQPFASQAGAFARFGHAASTLKAASQITQDLGPLTKGAHNLYQLLAGDPGRRIIFMDLVGWCGLRTVIDYNRELFYFKKQSDQDDKHKGNIPAAVERIQREMTATLSDVAIAGPLLAHLTNLNDRMQKQFTGNFISQDFMEYISQSAKTLAKKLGQNKPLDADQLLTALFTKLGKDLGQGQSPEVQTQLAMWFHPQSFKQYLKPETSLAIKGLKNIFGGTTTQFNSVDAENQLAQLLGKVGDHSVSVANQGNLTNLLSNVHKFQDKVAGHFGQKGISLADLAKKLDSSVAVRQKMPLILGGIFLLNLLLPHLIQQSTRKNFGISTYPGELGLVQPQDGSTSVNYAAQTNHNHVFPFLSRALQAGNWLPLLGVALMLPAAVGVYRSGKLFSGGRLNLKEGFALPKNLSPKALSDYGKNWLKAHDFETSFPWAGEQQQATTYANTLLSRIATARSPIEFRERLIDSLLSYTAAFEMNSVIDKRIGRFIAEGKGAFSKGLQHLMGINQAKLFKPDGSIRTLNEIYSMADPKVRRDTLTAKTWQGWAATLFTTLTMGVFEPILCIFLTSKQADWMNARNNRKHFDQASQGYGQARLNAVTPAFSAFVQPKG